MSLLRPNEEKGGQEKEIEREGDTEGKKEKTGREKRVEAGKPRKKAVVQAADACRRCNGNFHWLKGGEEVGAEGDSERERERERANEEGRRARAAETGGLPPVPAVETGRGLAAERNLDETDRVPRAAGARGLRHPVDLPRARGLTFVFAKGGKHRGHGCIICLLWKPGILSSRRGEIAERGCAAFHTLSRASAGDPRGSCVSYGQLLSVVVVLVVVVVVVAAAAAIWLDIGVSLNAGGRQLGRATPLSSMRDRRVQCARQCGLIGRRTPDHTWLCCDHREQDSPGPPAPSDRTSSSFVDSSCATETRFLPARLRSIAIRYRVTSIRSALRLRVWVVVRGQVGGSVWLTDGWMRACVRTCVRASVALVRRSGTLRRLRAVLRTLDTRLSLIHHLYRTTTPAPVSRYSVQLSAVIGLAPVAPVKFLGEAILGEGVPATCPFYTVVHRCLVMSVRLSPPRLDSGDIPGDVSLKIRFKDLDLSSLFCFSYRLFLSDVSISPESAALLSFSRLVFDSLDLPIANATTRLAWKSLVLRVFWGTLLIGSGRFVSLYTPLRYKPRLFGASVGGECVFTRRGAVRRDATGGTLRANLSDLLGEARDLGIRTCLEHNTRNTMLLLSG
ncbi:hypothetical protein DBV15_02192 [Temnothorax longispinosus]|uniref:Uncharacterized protein n=1 Tax=Temnothorax longispinosus TaxID=300112 RepID=A0A4S2JSY3_9HYME|nr:hypothetical protein DBV15_02192 [Temnothorax longispinosus]